MVCVWRGRKYFGQPWYSDCKLGNHWGLLGECLVSHAGCCCFFGEEHVVFFLEKNMTVAMVAHKVGTRAENERLSKVRRGGCRWSLRQDQSWLSKSWGVWGWVQGPGSFLQRPSFSAESVYATLESKHEPFHKQWGQWTSWGLRLGWSPSSYRGNSTCQRPVSIYLLSC